jgi:hypothetical protein
VKYAVETISCVMMYIPSFMEIGSGIQKLVGRGEYTDSKVIS